MVLREEVPYRLGLRWLLGVGALALLGIPALTSGQPPVETAKPAVTAVTITDEPSADRDQRIKELEDKVQALLKEIQALRGGQTKQPKPGEKHATPKGATGQWHYEAVKVAGQPSGVEVVYTVPGYTSSVVVGDKRDQGGEAGGPVNQVTLIRATYKLKQTQAEALGKFLSENVKSSVMETKVDGDNVIVTTTPDAQQVVMQIIALMQGKRALRQTFYYQGARPKEQVK